MLEVNDNRVFLGLGMGERMGREVGKVCKLLRKSRHAIAFTGAGVSAESGIPTFRGGKGAIWRKYRIEDLATPEAFISDPARVWRWYVWRMKLVMNAKPNPAHETLALLEKEGMIEAIITQNVDGLHQRAGSKRVIELHGSIWRVRCVNIGCGNRFRISGPPKEIPPKCPKCGSFLRPDVVWFGEPLPQDAWSEAVDLANKSDLAIVIGTSGVVYPAAYIPLIVKERGGTLVEININKSAITPYADIFIEGKAGEIMAELKGRCLKLLT